MGFRYYNFLYDIKDPSVCNIYRRLIFVHTDVIESFFDGGDGGGTRSDEWVADDTVWWCDKTNEVLHESERFDCGVGVAETAF